MLKDLVEELLEDALKKRGDLFLIDLEVLSGNSIRVVIDGDHGVQVEDCVFVSRAIEHNIDRDEYDFALEVTSAGATSPLSHKRQYIKNVGRVLQLKTKSGEEYEATLKEIDGDKVRLQWKSREPKPVGKGKRTVVKNVEIPLEEVDSARVKIKF